MSVELLAFDTDLPADLFGEEAASEEAFEAFNVSEPAVAVMACRRRRAHTDPHGRNAELFVICIVSHVWDELMLSDDPTQLKERKCGVLGTR